MKQEIRPYNPKNKTKIILNQIVEIVEKYERQGFQMTVRQVYYQMVARGHILNKQSEYQKISRVLTDARYAGIIDWSSIIDGARIPDLPSYFDNIDDLYREAKNSFKLDRWQGQEYYIELMTEKDAISTIIEPITTKYQITRSVGRGFTSATAVKDMARRFMNHRDKKRVLLYLGDFDPEGLRISEHDLPKRLGEFEIGGMFNVFDNPALLKDFGLDADSVALFKDTANMFSNTSIRIERIALNRDQIDKYNPPPQFAKNTSPNKVWYTNKYGTEDCWEVDALPPDAMIESVENAILKYFDESSWNKAILEEKRQLKKLSLSKKPVG